MLITARVVGSVVDAGIPSEEGEGTRDVAEDTGLSRVELACWPASELPCCLEAELTAVAPMSERATTGSARLQDAFCDKRAIKAERKVNL